MKRYLLFLFLFVCSSIWAYDACPLRIALVTDHPCAMQMQLRETLIKETKKLLQNSYALVFSDPSEFVADGKKEGVCLALESALDDASYDMVVALGPIASYEAIKLKSPSKPVFAPLIFSTALQNVPFDGEGSGVKNLSYISQEVNIDTHLKLLQKLRPTSHLAFFISQSLVQAMPKVVETVITMGHENGMKVTVIPIQDEGVLCPKAIPEMIDAAYLATMPLERHSEIKAFANALLEKNIISYSFASSPYVEDGILLSQTRTHFLTRLMRRLAINIENAALGEDLANFPVCMHSISQLMINQETARSLGLSLPFDMSFDAEFLGDCRPKISLSLCDAINIGMAENTILQAKYRQLQAGLQIPEIARSRLFPQIEVGASANVHGYNDSSRYNDGKPEKNISPFVGLQQMIYSNELIGRYRVAQDESAALIEDFQETYLETVQKVASAYFRLLRAQSIEGIQRRNLDLTRSNLLLAEQRVVLGMARTNEVYRWESAFADNRAKVVAAAFQVRSHMAELLRLLNQPQGEEVCAHHVPLESACWLFPNQWFAARCNTCENLETFALFLVTEGMKLSPVIQQFAYNIYARGEALGIAERRFWAPDIFFDSFIKQRLHCGGRKHNEPFFPADSHWSVGINLRFPLFTGGRKSAELKKAEQELLQAQFAFESSQEIVEQKIRTSLYEAIASYTAIGLTESGSVFAKKNLVMIKERYGNGKASILDLLDAQRQALFSELAHTRAIYAFFIDLMALQKNIGRFDFLLDTEEKDAIRAEFEEYFTRCMGS